MWSQGVSLPYHYLTSTNCHPFSTLHLNSKLCLLSLTTTIVLPSRSARWNGTGYGNNWRSTCNVRSGSRSSRPLACPPGSWTVVPSYARRRNRRGAAAAGGANPIGTRQAARAPGGRMRCLWRAYRARSTSSPRRRKPFSTRWKGTR